MPDIQLIVGLGNPGSDYVGTRHNVGFEVVDAWADKENVRFSVEKKFNGLVARFSKGDQDVFLLKPMTYMNHSGNSVLPLVRFFKIPVEKILVVHDDVDLQPGRIKLKQGGGHGGHNGLKSIDKALASNNYFRLRLGIGHPERRIIEGKPVNSEETVAQYVLNRFSNQDQSLLERAYQKIIDLENIILKAPLAESQQQLNTF